MHLFIVLVLIFIGVQISIFSVSQIIFSLFFSFPFTRYLDKLSALNDPSKIRKRYILAVTLNSSLIILLGYLLFKYVEPRYSGPLVVGAMFGLLSVLTSLFDGLTPELVRDYVDVSRPYFKSDRFADLLSSDGFSENWYLNREKGKDPLRSTVKEFYELDIAMGEIITKAMSKTASLNDRSGESGASDFS